MIPKEVRLDLKKPFYLALQSSLDQQKKTNERTHTKTKTTKTLMVEMKSLFLSQCIAIMVRNGLRTFAFAGLPPPRPGAAPWKTSCLTCATQVKTQALHYLVLEIKEY